MWNELVKDGEIVTEGSEGLINSAGVLAKKGKHMLCYVIAPIEILCDQLVQILLSQKQYWKL